ncbi:MULTISPECIES: hypothetical protein [unclassified Haloarcula]|uniref:hypothetical protein n=1 Tax=unclassified Haloarcula TaxID=2624677 RepID=UPI000EF132AE|nr:MULTISPECIES: hypothetical protein [unclassified Haloarcula]RLM47501.1 hypothetical protein DVK00_03050 [Haloarcula sp. Atlit-47R]RLM97296.1 hypothetical protein D3D01_05720 [Haloarcula sp. Atlit-7R]
MDQLSSCYFCGGALDVSLSEYPIIPKSLDPGTEEQGTVVLCSTCREKLATIVEPAVEAAKADARETAEPAGDAGTDEQPGLLDESGTPTTDEPKPTDGVVEPTDDGSLLGADSASPAQEQSAQSAETADTATKSDATDTVAPNTTDTQTAESAETDDAPATTETRDTDRDADSDDSPSLTKLEYNKVMRLLQNREMPVDRGEIREVAVNAYDIDGEQFDAIIDAAVDRDLIGQDKGRLVESDG